MVSMLPVPMMPSNFEAKHKSSPETAAILKAVGDELGLQKSELSPPDQFSKLGKSERGG